MDPARIAREARAIADPDVCCFQEVAAGFAALPGSSGEDQAALLTAGFPGFSAHFAWGVDVPGAEGGRSRFGNLILSRLPVRRVLRHALPWPAAPGLPSMPRVALEAVIDAPGGALRVVTTHLEYYSGEQRAAQIARLLELQAEAAAHAAAAPSAQYAAGPFAPLERPAASILTGDFNMRPEDPLLAHLGAVYADAWRLARPGEPHAPTFRLHGAGPGETPYCCDYIFVSEGLAARVADVSVDARTQASDHQPVVLRLRP